MKRLTILLLAIMPMVADAETVVPLYPVPIVHVEPIYPPEALARDMDGRVVLQFDVVPIHELEPLEEPYNQHPSSPENIVVIESTDPIFDQAAIKSVERFIYKGRVVDGVTVTIRDVQTTVTFKIGAESRIDESPTGMHWLVDWLFGINPQAQYLEQFRGSHVTERHMACAGMYASLSKNPSISGIDGLDEVRKLERWTDAHLVNAGFDKESIDAYHEIWNETVNKYPPSHDYDPEGQWHSALIDCETMRRNEMP